MQKNIEIADMTASHLDAVENIERELFHTPWTSEMYGAELKKDYSHHFVLLDDDKVIGYYGFFTTYDGEAEVTNIAVTKAYQGNGYGDLIMNSMLDKADKLAISKIFLEVRESNTKARNLYEKHNFNMINIRKKYYDGIENACIYMWQR